MGYNYEVTAESLIVDPSFLISVVALCAVAAISAVAISGWILVRRKKNSLPESSKRKELPVESIPTGLDPLSPYPLIAWQGPKELALKKRIPAGLILHQTAVPPWREEVLRHQEEVLRNLQIDLGEVCLDGLLPSPTQPALPKPVEFPVNDTEICKKFQEDLTCVFAERTADLSPLLSKLQGLWYRAFTDKEVDFQTHLEEVFQSKAHAFSSTLQDSLYKLWDLGRIARCPSEPLSPMEVQVDLNEKINMCLKIAQAAGYSMLERGDFVRELMSHPLESLHEMARQLSIDL